MRLLLRLPFWGCPSPLQTAWLRQDAKKQLKELQEQSQVLFFKVQPVASFPKSWEAILGPRLGALVGWPVFSHIHLGWDEPNWWFWWLKTRRWCSDVQRDLDFFARPQLPVWWNAKQRIYSFRRRIPIIPSPKIPSFWGSGSDWQCFVQEIYRARYKNVSKPSSLWGYIWNLGYLL